MKHLGTKTIQTGRLLLRELDIEDAPALYRNWGQYASSVAYLRLEPFTARKQMREFVDRATKKYKNPDVYHWVITIAETEEPIGVIGLNTVNEHDEVGTFSYSIGQPYWGNGYTAEALSAIFQYAFREIGFNRVEAYHATGNGISGDVMKECGMQYEGRARQKYKSDNGFEDCEMYAILREDFLKDNPK